MFLAGQINGQPTLSLLLLSVCSRLTLLGTTGYEEAAAQGALAGINAGLAALGRPPLVLSRADGFLGVMVDDLILKGAEEPCTSFQLVRLRLTVHSPCVRSHVHLAIRVSNEHPHLHRRF